MEFVCFVCVEQHVQPNLSNLGMSVPHKLIN